ncbi:Pre-mRNA splicing factor-domain-containing protein [Penicillium maclennaniae]|uniref:Pre-mRNA splicing factor-domain-containing protein n=1 Tax=Penicillium maclennaniae TaxID=1343394 RepID=UPI0025404727|nr:Pre-mRNA splicing factor-domain-containing protein [Penicillium maclennaniae]KAJ5666226.1 Pre-mRNA splicing factor-domain-containing protein [Penicillium maclennaniae]
MGGDLNLKKSWHPGLMRNQERVWSEEKRALEERKRIDQLRRERDEERQMQEIQRLHEASGKPKQLNRVDWMYQAPSSATGHYSEEMEGYLLGKRRIDGILLKNDTDNQKLEKGADLAGANAVAAAAAGPSVGSQRDTMAKVMADPLFEVKKREQAAYEAMVKEAVRRKERRRNAVLAMEIRTALQSVGDTVMMLTMTVDPTTIALRAVPVLDRLCVPIANIAANVMIAIVGMTDTVERIVIVGMMGTAESIGIVAMTDTAESTGIVEKTDAGEMTVIAATNERGKILILAVEFEMTGVSVIKTKTAPDLHVVLHPGNALHLHAQQKSAVPAAIILDETTTTAFAQQLESEEERRRKLAEMQSNATNLESDRRQRIAEITTKEEQQAEADDKQRSERGQFMSQIHKRAQEDTLDERIKRSRGGLSRMDDD